MRILYVIGSMNPRVGGPAQGVRILAAQDIDRGDTPEVVCMDDPSESFISDIPAKVFALGPARGRYLFSRRLVGWLNDRAATYDAVVVNGLWQFQSWAVQRWAARTSRQYFLMPHGMLGAWFKKTHRLKHLKKWLYWMFIERCVVRDARALLFTTAEELAQAKGTFPLYESRAASVVGFAAHDGPSNPEGCRKDWIEKHPKLRNKRIVLVLGRLHPVKGCDIALQGFSAVAALSPDVDLVFAGPDELGTEKKLRGLAHELQLGERVHWVGMLNDYDKWGALLSAEVLLSASHHENFGVAIVEALACARPVLISNQISIWREIAAHGGGIVEANTPGGVQSMLGQWLQMSAEDRAVMAARARESYEKTFSVARFASVFRATLEAH